MQKRFQVVTVTGTPYERGVQHGRQLREEIQSFLYDDVARINKVRLQPLTMEQALHKVDGYIPYIEQDVPELAEEIRGLADGADISYREAMLLQVRRELLSRGLECSSLMYKNQGQEVVLAQNVDLPGNLTDLGIILHVKANSQEQPDILMFTHVGLLGYLGLNSYGIGVGLNMVLSPGWREGVPPYLLIRNLLHQRTLDDCLMEIRRIRRTSSRNLLVTDSIRCINIEMTVEEDRVIEHPLLLHTNHYLHHDFCPVDLVSKTTSTFDRLNRLEEMFGQYDNQPTVEQIKIVLQDHQGYPRSICAHGQGDFTRGETISSVILQPSKGVLLATKGNPCEQEYETFSLNKIFEVQK